MEGDYGNSYIFPYKDVAEDESLTAYISCYNSDLSACPIDSGAPGDEIKLAIQGCSAEVGLSSSVKKSDRKVYEFTGHVRQDFGCDPGVSQPTEPAKFDFITPRNTVSGGTVYVRPVASGQYLNVQLDPETGDKDKAIYQFHFTDKPDHQCGIDGVRCFSAPEDKAALLINNDNQIADLGDGTVDKFEEYVIEPGEAGMQTQPDGKSSLNELLSRSPDKACMDGCWQATDEIVKMNFFRNTLDRCDKDSFSEGDKCFLNHEYDTGANPYMPRGEIIVAYPDQIGSNPQEEFFMCDPGNPATDGKVVYVSELKKYKCNAESGRWEKIYECNDGKDNDNNGDVDHKNDIPNVPVDPNCDSKTDNSEEDTQPDCPPLIKETPNQKVAYYDGNTDEGSFTGIRDGCTYKQDTTIARGEPELFTCYESTTSDETSSGQQRFCDTLFSADFTGHGSSVKSVQYHVPKSAIPTSDQDPQLASRFVADSGRSPSSLPEKAQCTENTETSGGLPVTSGGFVNTRCETLHTAEKSYSRSPGGETVTPHSLSHWKSRNLTDTGDGYQQAGDSNGDYGTGEEDRLDSWTIANATAQTNDKIFSPDTANLITDDAAFSGGFAGRCPTGKRWQHLESTETGSGNSAGWYCSGALDWPFKYYVPDLDKSGNSVKTGIFLQKEIFRTGDIGSAPPTSFTAAWFRQNDGEVATIEKIRYDCYPGKPGSQTPTWKTFDVPDTSGNPFSSTVFLPDTVSTSGVGEYSCEFQFKIQKSDGTMTWESDLGSPQEVSDDRAGEVLGLGDYVGTKGDTYITLDKPGDADSQLPGPDLQN
ncbi:MAG: hypothetical protein ABEJ07_04855 [Candidatus Nanohaloarchaea archaeon]